MKITGTLLLASILTLAIVAPPLYPQRQRSEREILNDLELDVIRLTETMNKLQASADSRSAKTLQLVEQIYDKFVALDSSVQKLSDAVAGIRSSSDKSTTDLQALRVVVDSLRGSVTEIREGLTGLNAQVRNVSDKVTTLNTTAEELPTAGELWLQAYSDYSAGHYDIAIPEFRDLVAQYPADPRAPNALIHIGKSHAAARQFDMALVAFDEALQKYPTSDKTCSALYEKGQTLVAMKKNPEAKAALQQVVKECVGTAEAGNASAALKGLR